MKSKRKNIKFYEDSMIDHYGTSESIRITRKLELLCNFVVRLISRCAKNVSFACRIFFSFLFSRSVEDKKFHPQIDNKVELEKNSDEGNESFVSPCDICSPG